MNKGANGRANTEHNNKTTVFHPLPCPTLHCPFALLLSFPPFRQYVLLDCLLK